MEALRLYYPAKPYAVTQGWGVANPSYRNAGMNFDRHNGEDFRIGDDKLVHCPVPAICIDTGYDQWKGNFARFITTEEWTVDGLACHVGFVAMHGEKVLCEKGQTLKVGDQIMIPDNTGFSTGPHTHISYYRLGGIYMNQRLDTDVATDFTFDPHPYWTGYHAQDYGTLVHTLQALVAALTAIVRELTQRRSTPPAPATQIS
jgi:murein DD-endopeptidase MepM/ murein hydrolase activator NlpD